MTTGNEATGLTPERIQFTAEPLQWTEAIAGVAAPLIADGSVESGYVDAVVETARKMGPYFDFGKGIAVPHARPEAGVNRIALSFLRTRTPVLLLDDEEHPIDLFIMLAATDSSSHLQVLQGLATVLTDNAAVEALKAAQHPEEVLAIFGETNKS